MEQIGYAEWQGSGHETQYNNWKNASNTDDAAYNFRVWFERCGESEANDTYRKSEAAKFYQEFHGKTYSATNGDGSNNTKVKELKNQYKQDSTYTGSGQCFGFVNVLTKAYYGTACDVWDFSNGTNTHTKCGTGWTKSDSTSAIDNLKPGDAIRWHRSSTNSVGHSAWVIAVNGENVTIAEANYSGPNKIDWTRTITKSAIKDDHFDYVCIAPYAIGEK